MCIRDRAPTDRAVPSSRRKRERGINPAPLYRDPDRSRLRTIRKPAAVEAASPDPRARAGAAVRQRADPPPLARNHGYERFLHRTDTADQAFRRLSKDFRVEKSFTTVIPCCGASDPRARGSRPARQRTFPIRGRESAPMTILRAVFSRKEHARFSPPGVMYSDAPPRARRTARNLSQEPFFAHFRQLSLIHI